MNNLIVYDLNSDGMHEFDVPDSMFQEWYRTRDILVKVLEFEIIYDQVIEAYWAYRNQVNYWNLRSVSRPFSDYVNNHEIRSSLNRLAFNLLNLSKLYLDWHFNKDRKRCFASEITDDESTKKEVDSQRKHIYESNLNYVIGCKLRGHSQHSALPVSSFTTGLRYAQETRAKTVHFSIYYYHDDLDKIGVPKGRIHRDIKLDLTDILDGYIFAISEMHMLNRKLTESVVFQTQTKFLDLWQNQISQTGCSSYRCEIYTNDQVFYQSLDWFKVFDYLKTKHSSAIDYAALTFTK